MMSKEVFLLAIVLTCCQVPSAHGTTILPSPFDVSVYVTVDDSFEGLFQQEPLVNEFIETALNGATLRYASIFKKVHVRLIPDGLSEIGPGNEGYFMKLRSDGHLDAEQSLRRFVPYAAEGHRVSYNRRHQRSFTKEVVLLITGKNICKSSTKTDICEVIKGTAAPSSLCTNESAAILTLTTDIQESTDRIATYIGKIMGAGIREEHDTCPGEGDIFNDRDEADMIAYLQTLDQSCLSQRKNPRYFLTPGSRFRKESFCLTKLPGRPAVSFCGDNNDLSRCKIRCCSPGKYVAAEYTAPDGTVCSELKDGTQLQGGATWSNSSAFQEAKLCF
uniref:Secreted metalloprotease n=1 Tax=Ornithodoros erraticus TaxID=265619 RepID=A0A293LJ54_ORNER